ncbi:helix-turn-helix transcriptional regulator [Actinomycetospora soli]|uniref:helix-turn-helix transcriptional regulator n=1 Tax=Actinomycetospora soli TaxID=2893887 RepID=UPI001E4B6A42|nr:LuxR family transcriptional regulator [Actinomycetospora soli]MCD2188832.1 LuxR C-terminal-related transcriptional regulator [Actinomycetospora soli]
MRRRPTALSAPLARRREIALLADEVRSKREDGVVRVVRGEPGSGKTTLVGQVADLSGRRVLRARAAPGESALPFAVAADLLLPLRPRFGALPAVQREALEVSLSLRSGTAGSPLTVCTAALGALAAAAERTPLLVLVDDFPWADAASRRLLLFVAHRLAPERIALLLTSRDEVPDEPDTAGLPTLDLGPLPREEARGLARAAAPDAHDGAVEDLVDQAQGNPLAVVEMARELGGTAGSSTVGLHRTWDAALDAVPARTAEALAVVALGRDTGRAAIEPVLTDLGLDVTDLVPAQARRLVVVGKDEVVLRHGLLRTAVLARTPLERRAAVLERFAAHTDEHLAVWYEAGATSGVDDALADRLVDAARRARDRAAPLDAAHAWERAAGLTSDPLVRTRRLLHAAIDAQLGGRVDLARAWCDEGLRLAPTPDLTADLELVRARCLMWLGRPRAAVAGAVRASDASLEHDPARAVALRAEAALPCALIGDVQQMVAIAHEVRAIAAPAGHDVPLAVCALLGYAESLAGRLTRARGALDEATWDVPVDPRQDGHARATYALALHFAERPRAARQLVDEVVDSAREVGAPVLLAFALLVRAEIESAAGQWAEAYADAGEGTAWAEEFDQVASRSLAALVMARIDAVRGDSASCRRRVDEALAVAGPHGFDSMTVYAAAALGADALARGDAEAAVAHLDTARALCEEHGMANPVVAPFGADLVEAHLHVGDREGALDALAWIEARSDSRLGAVVACAARGQLADDPDEAESAFAEAYRGLDASDRPFERARILLAHAATRRRWRRVLSARPLLLEARTRFAALGAEPWSERARAELAATGFRPPDEARPADAAEGLTPQEFQVARFVSEGRNNVETAAALFVSRKTVEAHLTRIYRKLGVRSRKELVAALRDREAGRPR